MNIFDIFAAASFEYAVYSNLAATDPWIPRRMRGKRHHHGGNVVDCCV